MSISALFSKKKNDGKSENANPKQNQEQVLQKLDDRINELNARIEQQDKISKKFHLEAKAKMKAKDKVGAQKALVKKKRAVKQIKVWEGALALFEQQKMTLENASTMKDIYKTVIDMNKAIKEAQGNMNIEDLEKVKEDFEEMKDTANEISEYFQSQTEEELGEVDNDLAELEQEIENEKMDLPEANKEPVQKQQQEVKNNDEKELEDFMS